MILMFKVPSMMLNYLKGTINNESILVNRQSMCVQVGVPPSMVVSPDARNRSKFLMISARISIGDIPWMRKSMARP